MSNPSPWREAVDPTTKKTYYFNKITQETRWKKPDDYVATGKVYVHNDEDAALMASTTNQRVVTVNPEKAAKRRSQLGASSSNPNPPQNRAVTSVSRVAASIESLGAEQLAAFRRRVAEAVAKADADDDNTERERLAVLVNGLEKFETDRAARKAREAEARRLEAARKRAEDAVSALHVENAMASMGGERLAEFSRRVREAHDMAARHGNLVDKERLEIVLMGVSQFEQQRELLLRDERRASGGGRGGGRDGAQAPDETVYASVADVPDAPHVTEEEEAEAEAAAARVLAYNGGNGHNWLLRETPPGESPLNSFSQAELDAMMGSLREFAAGRPDVSLPAVVDPLERRPLSGSSNGYSRRTSAASSDSADDSGHGSPLGGYGVVAPTRLSPLAEAVEAGHDLLSVTATASPSTTAVPTGNGRVRTPPKRPPRRMGRSPKRNRSRTSPSQHRTPPPKPPPPLFGRGATANHANTISRGDSGAGLRAQNRRARERGRRTTMDGTSLNSEGREELQRAFQDVIDIDIGPPPARRDRGNRRRGASDGRDGLGGAYAGTANFGMPQRGRSGGGGRGGRGGRGGGVGGGNRDSSDIRYRAPRPVPASERPDTLDPNLDSMGAVELANMLDEIFVASRAAAAGVPAIPGGARAERRGGRSASNVTNVDFGGYT